MYFQGRRDSGIGVLKHEYDDPLHAAHKVSSRSAEWSRAGRWIILYKQTSRHSWCISPFTTTPSVHYTSGTRYALPRTKYCSHGERKLVFPSRASELAWGALTVPIYTRVWVSPAQRSTIIVRGKYARSYVKPTRSVSYTASAAAYMLHTLYCSHGEREREKAVVVLKYLGVYTSRTLNNLHVSLKGICATENKRHSRYKCSFKQKSTTSWYCSRARGEGRAVHAVVLLTREGRRGTLASFLRAFRVSTSRALGQSPWLYRRNTYNEKQTLLPAIIYTKAKATSFV